MRFMTFSQGGIKIVVNMALVAWMGPNNSSEPAAGTVLYFPTVFQDEPLYLCVDEPLDEIANRKEWQQ